MNRSGAYVTQLGGCKAFMPSPLPPKPPLRLSRDFQNLLSKADMALARLDGLGHVLPNLDLFITMYVRKEALLSSQIEGTQASLEDIFDVESGGTPQNLNDVEEVINYVKALNYGMKRLKTLPLSLRLMREIHGILMQGARGGHKGPGEFRRSQNWIGPAGCTLNGATFVPPPPQEANKAMGELERYLHRTSQLPVLVECALVHYQFETVHPFLDGNGRLGRLMITFHLYWRAVLNRPLLYLSYFFKKNRQEYYDRLEMVRAKGDYEQWVGFFLRGVLEAAESAVDAAKKILELQTAHRNLLWEKKMSSPLAVGLLEKLFYTPYLSVKEVAHAFSVSFQAASTLVSQFESAGILREITGRKRDKRYVYVEYLSILSEGTK